MTDPPFDGAIASMLQRVNTTADEAGAGFPVYADPATGSWTRADDGFWTGGFWCGLLWLAAQLTGDMGYRVRALRWAERLRARAGSDTALRGFLFWYGAGIGAVLAGDGEARDLALAGARGLASSYQPRARLIPLGNAFAESPDTGRLETNVDGVTGVVCLLAWAAEGVGEPSLGVIARAHAARHVELCLRPDGSVSQSASVDPRTGEVLRRYTQKGLHDHSTWSRAQAWAMLGFAQATRCFSGEFMDAAIRASDWWVDHLPSTGVVPWDFDDAAGTPVDTSATAIAAAALLKMGALAPARAERYHATAVRMVDALIACHLTPTAPDDRPPAGMLVDGCYDRRTSRATSHELIWGDYFLFEALLCLAGHLEPAAI